MKTTINYFCLALAFIMTTGFSQDQALQPEGNSPLQVSLLTDNSTQAYTNCVTKAEEEYLTQSKEDERLKEKRIYKVKRYQGKKVCRDTHLADNVNTGYSVCVAPSQLEMITCAKNNSANPRNERQCHIKHYTNKMTCIAPYLENVFKRETKNPSKGDFVSNILGASTNQSL
ncbi:MAG: hypothetical protein HOI59_06285 [Nitrospina sp.]|jgi:hypothetical protein|nr:hypothetical protein [Nitrospina sp.]MBT3415520.1 hypothetical protein [Nitrospina sp.]MBT3855831.1 hypothetical protein [Nitrospina sp.]MBT4105802.1 hypothetical protein [Nitrospina sp.]MBT4390842.1 hypothetical protein [Nitrospina sp.]